MVIEIESSSFIRDRNSLDKAHELKEKANLAYKERDYSAAVRLYHQCLLNAKAVVQLSLTNLQAMARNERDEKPEYGFNFGATKSEHVEEDLIQVDEEEDQPITDMNEFQAQNSRLRIDSTSRGEEMKQEATSLIIKCYNNLAACIVNGPPRQKDDYMRAVYYCDKVLDFEPDNDKAIFRKGCALQKAEKYEKAVEEFQKCKNNSQAAAATEECRMKTVEERKKRDATIRANFAKAHAAEQGNAERKDIATRGEVNRSP
uniref:Uncharacterized protein n=1 Tax=Ditylenchus dipsaci TaxID=166011 RepID=A0A915CTA0_9BILA